MATQRQRRYQLLGSHKIGTRQIEVGELWQLRQQLRQVSQILVAQVGIGQLEDRQAGQTCLEPAQARNKPLVTQGHAREVQLAEPGEPAQRPQQRRHALGLGQPAVVQRQPCHSRALRQGRRQPLQLGRAHVLEAQTHRAQLRVARLEPAQHLRQRRRARPRHLQTKSPAWKEQ